MKISFIVCMYLLMYVSPQCVGSLAARDRVSYYDQFSVPVGCLLRGRELNILEGLEHLVDDREWFGLFCGLDTGDHAAVDVASEDHERVSLQAGNALRYFVGSR